jgi:hypothetical protein
MLPVKETRLLGALEGSHVHGFGPGWGGLYGPARRLPVFPVGFCLAVSCAVAIRFLWLLCASYAFMSHNKHQCFSPVHHQNVSRGSAPEFPLHGNSA